MVVRSIVETDRATWLRMRYELWPNSCIRHEKDIDNYFSEQSKSIDEVALIDSDGKPAGFIELRIRNYAEGSSQATVPFVEGLYVLPEFRRQGLSGQLLAYAENWSRELGFSELASNTEIDNNASESTHTAFGFKEIERSISFLKKL